MRVDVRVCIYVFMSYLSHLELQREMEAEIEIKRDTREIGVVAR